MYYKTENGIKKRLVQPVVVPGEYTVQPESYIDESGNTVKPEPVTMCGRKVYTTDPEILALAGYVWEDDPAVEQVEPVKRYSKHSIAKRLGRSGYDALRAKLDEAGMLYLFDAANELATDDENFAAFVASLSNAELAMLEDCRI